MSRRVWFALVVCFVAWMACASRGLRADDAALVEKSMAVKAIAATPKDGEHLIECILSTLHPHGWEAVGGRSTIKWQRGELVVFAPESVQKQIAKLVETLEKLPHVNAKEAAATPKDLRFVLGEAGSQPTQVTAVYPVADLLRGPAVASEALNQIAELIESTVTPYDWVPVGDGAIASFASRGALVVSQSKKGHDQVEALLVALRKTPPVTKEALDKPPKPVSITAGSQKLSDTEFVTITYPVADLVTDGKSAQARAVNGATAKSFDFDRLEEVITSSIAPTTWDSVGGTGVVREFDPRLVLVVSHTKETHKHIESLFAGLRKLPRYSAQATRRAAVVPITVAETKDAEVSKQIVVYDVASRVTTGVGEYPDFDSLIEHVYGIDGVTWDLPLVNFGTIEKFPARGALVVLQTKENHVQIVKAINAFDPKKIRE